MSGLSPMSWRYEIKHGPNGEADYAWVYDDQNNMVCVAKTHHAIAIVGRVAPVSTKAGGTSNLIERLLSFASRLDDTKGFTEPSGAICREAAEELEFLQSDNASLRRSESRA